MTTRQCFVPHNAFGRQMINTLIQKIECSIDHVKLNSNTGTIQFCITCNDKDSVKIEKILKRFDLL